jgi:hypothetical protein
MNAEEIKKLYEPLMQKETSTNTQVVISRTQVQVLIEIASQLGDLNRQVGELVYLIRGKGVQMTPEEKRKLFET